MDYSRVSNALRNTKWGLLQKIFNLLFPFLVRFVLIHTLGAEYSGLNGLFISVLSVLNLTELGFSNAIIYSMYQPVAENDTSKVCALLNTYRKAYRIIGVIVLTLGLLITFVIPHLVNGEIPVDINIYILYLIFLLDSVIDYFLFGYKTSLLSVYQREDMNSKNILTYNFLLYSFQIASVLLFHKYYVYVIVYPLARVALNLLNNRTAKRMFPEITPNGDITKEEKKTLKKNILGLAIWKIGGASRNSFDSIFISMFMGLVTIAIYSNYFCIVNGVDMILSVICTSITAGVGNKIVLSTKEDNFRDFEKFQFLYMWIVGWCIVCIYCMIQPFMRLWMGEDLMFSKTIVILFCYYFYMMKKGDINSVYYHAAGLWWNGRYRSIVEAVLNLILNLVLGKCFGVIGILLATIFSFSIVNIYGSYIVFRDYFQNQKYISFCLKNVFCLMVIAVSCYLTELASSGLCVSLGINNDVLYLMICFVFCLIIPNALFFVVYRVNPDYYGYLKYAKSILIR